LKNNSKELAVLKDKRLSSNAKIAMLFMLKTNVPSKGTRTFVKESLGMSTLTVNKVFSDLIKLDYLKDIQVRDVKGRTLGTEISILSPVIPTDCIDNYRLQRKVYSASKNRANKSGIEFSIDIDDVVLPNLCPILGVPLDFSLSMGRRKRYGSSLDRIDNSKGYVKGNVWVISDLANRMKNNTNYEELISFAHGVLKHIIPLKNTTSIET
jgi:hypothetical protein